MNRPLAPRQPDLRRQRGVVLYVAIIVLVAMTMAGLAMMRQMGSGTSIAGNIAFKEGATSVADRGTEAARTWISNLQAVNAAALNNDDIPNGYHSSWAADVDPTTFNWPLQSVAVVGADTGNSARVYIERLCLLPILSPNAPTQVCSDKPTGLDPGRGGGDGPGGVIPPTLSSPYYRVTTRVDGPRNTRSYTQVIMQ